jgi:hypothetical protein
MALHRRVDEPGPLRPEPVERLSGRHERRRAESSRRMATGTLACPACDAPVVPGPSALSALALFSCGFCSHVGTLRDFLSLAEPTRPTRVAVRVRGLGTRWQRTGASRWRRA